MPSVKKTAHVAKECVACGCCMKVCTKQSIIVHNGLQAIVNGSTCIGCGKCAKICPAGVIGLQEVEAYEKAMV